MQPYSFLYLLEGGLGDNLKIIKRYKTVYTNPNGDGFKFDQNEQKIRDRYATKIKRARKLSKTNGKRVWKDLINRTQSRINRYQDEHGRLSDGDLTLTFDRELK